MLAVPSMPRQGPTLKYLCLVTTLSTKAYRECQASRRDILLQTVRLQLRLHIPKERGHILPLGYPCAFGCLFILIEEV
jgi:hypothetical protein